MACKKPPHFYRKGACIHCGKPDFWATISRKPAAKKHRKPAPTLAEIQMRLAKVKTPKGWTRIGVVLDSTGVHAIWFGKGHGKARKYQTISGLEA